MKRLLPTIPFIFFLLLNACGGSAITGASPVAGTLTVIGWTPISTSFPLPYNNRELFDILNASLPHAHSLQWTFDAEYAVTDVKFSNKPPGTTLIMDVRCLCKKENCCFLERTFVVMIDSMKNKRDDIILKMPNEVKQIVMVCYDYKNYTGALSVAWNDVKEYISENISGRDLIVRVTRTAVP